MAFEDPVEQKHPGGRPSRYREEFCERVIAMGKEGKGVAEWAAELDVAKQTIYNWKSEHARFLDACTRADDYCQAWWERAGREGMVSDKFNATVWQKNMNCRFRADWREQSDVNLNIVRHEQAIDELS